MNVAISRRSPVSCMVVKTRAILPMKLRNAVMKESCPVDPFLYIVSVVVSYQMKVNLILSVVQRFLISTIRIIIILDYQ